MKRFFFVLVSLLISLISFGKDVVVKVSSNFYVNWTKGQITFDYEGEVPYLAGKSFSQDILILKNSVKRKVISEASSFIEIMIFDNNRTVRNILEEFPERKTKVLSLLESIDIENFRTYRGKVFSRYSVNLFGEKGLFEILKLPSIPREYREFFNSVEPKDYTGLAINVSKLPLNLGLSHRIISEKGDVVYSYANFRGKGRYIYVFNSLEDAIRSGVLGDKILYVFPIDVLGENKTDIVLKDSDIRKLLSLKDNADVFSDGRVALILGD